MNAPAAVTQRSSLKDRLETALNSKASADELMAAISSACSASQNAAWEALALVDQYYRRRRISQDVYRTLKAHVERLALGRPSGGDRPPTVAAKPSPDLREATGRHPAIHAPPSAGTAAPATPRPLGPPRAGLLLRGRYRLEARLDYGNGVVFQALDEFRKELPDEEQRVAIRFPADAADAQREFFRAQHLSHPNIARVIEFDRDGDTAFYTMELQHGRLLRDVLKQADRLPLPHPEALAIVRDIAAALQHAHSRSVLHGRLDTASVLIARDGVRVLNFGLPRRDNEVVKPADDLHTLCLIAYELFAGRSPFDGRTLVDARQRGLRLRRPPGLHRRQWRALQRGLAASGKGRSITIEQWLEDMEVRRAVAQNALPHELMHSPPPVWPRRLMLGGVLVAFTVAVVVIAISWQSLLRDPARVAAGSEPGVERLAPIARDATAAQTQTGNMPNAVAITPAPASAPTTSPAPTAPPASASPATPTAAATPNAQSAALTPGAPAATDSGAGLLGFQSETFTVAPGEAAARIPVRRTGGTRGDVGFVWSTESSTARAGDDFVSFGEQRELIPGGQKSVSLYVPLSGGARTTATEFYVNIGEPSGGARLGRIARLKIIIAPDE